MINYRRLTVNIDCETGRLVNDDGDTITRDEYLPHIIYADTFILQCNFVTVTDDSTLEAAELNSSFLSPRIIGNLDSDGSSIMFGANFYSSGSNFSDGIVSFLINTNTTRFQEVLATSTTNKAEFAVYSVNSTNSDELIVLAKDYFIAESRPVE